MDQFILGASLAVLAMAAGACAVAWAGEVAERNRRIDIARRRSKAFGAKPWPDRAGAEL